MSKRFEMIEHPSDVGIVAYGRDYKEVFENAAFAMFSIMAELSNVKTTESFSVKASGDDMEDLFVNWMNELVYLEDSKHVLFKEFVITQLTNTSLVAEAKGEHINRALHMMHRPIKAVTFNGLELTKNKARVIFDV